MDRVVAVGSGKGGVGKSTVAANLALALQDVLGLAVGLMDADIFGPSLPAVLGVEDAPKRARMTEDRKILPLPVHGLAFVSFGFFLGAGSPAIWRGPLVAKAVEQVSRGVVWPRLDVLVVDLPPGTGDAPLSLAQTIVLDGAVIVTTPQRLAVEEAEKTLRMLRTLDVPALGIVENMSVAACACGRRSHPFGRTGGRELARRAGLPLLAEIPVGKLVDPDSGEERPPMLSRSQGDVATVFRDLAREVAWRLARREVVAQRPSRPSSAAGDETAERDERRLPLLGATPR